MGSHSLVQRLLNTACKLYSLTRPIYGLFLGVVAVDSAIVWPLPASVKLNCWGPPLRPLKSLTWSRTHEDSTPNMFVYEFRIYHMSFVKKEHIKRDKTYIDTQGRFKANLSNIIDVLRRLPPNFET